MDVTEPALVHLRVADLHREAQAHRLVAAARTTRPQPHRSLRTSVDRLVDRLALRVRSLRPTTDGAQVCCA